jgi:hypothetical protein
MREKDNWCHECILSSPLWRALLGSEWTSDSWSLVMLPPTPYPKTLFANYEKEGALLFKEVWTPISFCETWSSLVGTVASNLALLLIWSEVIKAIILTQLHVPGFPQVAKSAPGCIFFSKLILSWVWNEDGYYWACCACWFSREWSRALYFNSN